MKRVAPYSLIFCISVITLFVLFGAIFTEAVGAAFSHLQSFIVSAFGWFYVLAAVCFLVFVLCLMFSSFGRIRLGRDDERPEYSFFTWFAMLFSAGMGIGLIFYSVAEPISHFNDPPRAVPGSLDAASDAMVITFFHWGLHAWAIYVVVGLSLAYFAYRHGLPLTIRSTLYPLLGQRVHGPLGSAVDTLAVFGTVFGLATSLGLGAMQVNAGLAHLGFVDTSTPMQIMLIIVITLMATISAATGLNKGIRRLSQLNIVLALFLLMAVFIAGPTMFLVSSYVQNIGSYAASLIELSFNTDAYIGTEWQEVWTMFYWGWWISWSPFVGMFIARVSRGRTIREFIAGVLLAPSLIIFFWLVVFGNTAIHFELAGDGGMVEAVQEDISTVIFVMFDALPLSIISSVIAMVVITVFFVTSADSGSLVVNILTAGGDPDPPMSRRAIGAVMIGAVAAILLLTGGLVALQTAAITTAMPFCVVMLFMCYALVKSLRGERVLRQGADGRASILPPDSRQPDRLGSGAPLAGATPHDGYTGSVPRSLAAAERQEDWRKRLQYVIQGYERYTKAAAERHEQAMPRIASFLDGTVLPAFEQIKAQLEEHRRSAEIEREIDRATLTVHRDGEQEFSYSVHCLVREPLTFAFPEFTVKPDEVSIRAEVVLSTGRSREYALDKMTKETIFNDFVAAYARWMGW
ncbi:MAG: BCCT family transporter [Phycisphaerales bacterium]|nr:MAG: BCCT family transporter [Phycisphaerales bacterium]